MKLKKKKIDTLKMTLRFSAQCGLAENGLESLRLGLGVRAQGSAGGVHPITLAWSHVNP